MARVRYLGVFSSMQAVWEQYPSGGVAGDWLKIGQDEYDWDENRRQWGDGSGGVSPSRRTDTFPGDVEIYHDLTVAGNINARQIRDAESAISQINTGLANRYTKQETYSKQEVNNLVSTPHQNYYTVAATSETTSVSSLLPSTGSADTIYRVGNWDGTQYDITVYTEYSWNGSAYVKLNTKTQVGEVFDITAYTGESYADLAAALGTNGVNVPVGVRHNGMEVSFKDSDGVYHQCRYMKEYANTTAGNTAFVNPANWQGVDDEPVAGSQNLVKSGGVEASFNTKLPYLTINRSNGRVLDSSYYYYAINIKQGRTYRIEKTSNYTRPTALNILFRKNFSNVGETVVTLYAADRSLIFVADSDYSYITLYNIGAGDVELYVYDVTERLFSLINSSTKFLTNQKVNEIGIDDVPTQDSSNLVKSGGVYAANTGLSNAISNVEQQITDVTLVSGQSTISATGSGNINLIPVTNIQVSSKVSKVRLNINGFNEYFTTFIYYVNYIAHSVEGSVDIPIDIDAEGLQTFRVVILRNSVTQAGEGKQITATLKTVGMSEDIQILSQEVEDIKSQITDIESQITGIDKELTIIEGGTLKTYTSSPLSQSVNNWLAGSSAQKLNINVGDNVDSVYINATGFPDYYTQITIYESHLPNGYIQVKSLQRGTLPVKLKVTDGQLTNFGIVIGKDSVTNDGVGKTVTSTISVKPIYEKDKPSCEDLIIKPSPFYTLPFVSGFSNFIPRIFIEGLMNDKLPKLRIDGNVTAPVSAGDDPLINSKSEWTNSPNNTATLPYVVSHEGYDDYEMEVTRHRTSPYKLVGKTVLHMNIGSSNTDGGEHGETALEDFLCTELSDLWDAIKTDTSKIDVKFIGTKKENTTFTFNGKTFTTAKSCNEGLGAWAIADYLRHIFMIRAFGFDNSTLQAWWCSLGLRTKTRNGVPGRETPVDYSYSSADQSKAFEMRNTCHGYYDADPCADLWNWIVDNYYLRGVSFTYEGVTYTFGQSYTGSQADDDIQIAWVKYACKTGIFNPNNANSHTDNPFYDYDTVQSSNGQYAFSLGAYLANYRTMDDTGVRLSNDSPSKGARVSDVNDWDVCKPKSVKIEMGGNDYNLGVNATMTAADNKLMADLISAYDPSIKIAIQEYRVYGALNPSFYSLAGLSVRKGGYNAYRMLYHKAITELFENGSMDNYYHLSNFVSQTILGQTKSVFDTLDDKEMLADYGTDYLHSTMFAYFDKAYQVVAWLCFINR